jgi:hypothetical protein
MEVGARVAVTMEAKAVEVVIVVTSPQQSTTSEKHRQGQPNPRKKGRKERGAFNVDEDRLAVNEATKGEEEGQGTTEEGKKGSENNS